ncbi:asparaginase [Streptomyces sp. NBC_00006]|uniref:asparaginase n=1 Tax=Streptomyces sp. NBC_00006 TaxID=2975619 RepID=UPI00225467B7|nr:asparaginase [Streptomyces sp. NBC_00006]MCX5535235.1 asparaginase [Streptomyces sp. NBC_00006]
MRTVVVITTGGTIASRSDSSGAKVASVSGPTLTSGLPLPGSASVRVVDLMKRNSYDIRFSEMDRINRAVRQALSASDTCGVVVTHGTDTLEETAMLVDLLHDDPRPVVFTGAQLSHDAPASDGPRNLADAIAVAASPRSGGLGVLVCFDGVLHGARGTRKVHTSAPAAFADADHGPVGTVVDHADVQIHTTLRRIGPVAAGDVAITRTRIDIVAVYPGADESAFEAHVAQGAHGIVLEATGYGNANEKIVAAVERWTRAGGHVVLSSRVPAGHVRPVYGGGGGGVDLVAAGAVPAGRLRPGQARILLATLIAAGRTRGEIATAFATEPDRWPCSSGAAAPTPTLPDVAAMR